MTKYALILGFIVPFYAVIAIGCGESKIESTLKEESNPAFLLSQPESSSSKTDEPHTSDPPFKPTTVTSNQPTSPEKRMQVELDVKKHSTNDGQSKNGTGVKKDIPNEKRPNH